MRKVNKILIVLVAILSIALLRVYAKDGPVITVVTEDLYPFNYSDGDEVKGIAVEKVKKAVSELGWENVSYKLLPWARAYNTALNKPNTLIFSMLRMEKREKLFKWVAKIGEMRLGAVKLKVRDDIKIKNIDELKKYKMAVFVDSPLVPYLNDKGIGITDIVGRYESVVPMLLQGRIDLVPGSVTGFLAEARKQGYEEIFEVAYYFDELSKDLYCAFSDETDDDIVNQFKDAFQKVNSN